ncbi:effector-associated constant component EACC1 [Nocardia testacea]|uniref:Uncharacterized protein n=1 Tax=Nocardia testacea TaxID=248551 RepID=A0ABW7VV26_9NOCA
MTPSVDRPLLYIRNRGQHWPDETRSLLAWLRDDPNLNGRLQLRAEFLQTGGLAEGIVQVLSVALGAGGVGAILAGSLSTWLTQRHSDIQLIVDDQDGRRIELGARRIRDVPQLLEQVARMLDEAQSSQTPALDEAQSGQTAETEIP